MQSSRTIKKDRGWSSAISGPEQAKRAQRCKCAKLWRTWVTKKKKKASNYFHTILLILDYYILQIPYIINHKFQGGGNSILVYREAQRGVLLNLPFHATYLIDSTQQRILNKQLNQIRWKLGKTESLVMVCWWWIGNGLCGTDNWSADKWALHYCGLAVPVLARGFAFITTLANTAVSVVSFSFPHKSFWIHMDRFHSFSVYFFINTLLSEDHPM